MHRCTELDELHSDHLTVPPFTWLWVLIKRDGLASLSRYRVDSMAQLLH